MKKLTIIRHAKSSWDNPFLPDIERELNDRGRRDAPVMARVIENLKLNPEKILCSTSVRTKQTHNLIFGKKYENQTQYLKKLYHASAFEILSAINEINDAISSLVVIGHNPGLTYFVNQLTNSEIENIPTTGICVIEVSSFEFLNFGEGKLQHFTYPKKFTRDKSLEV